MNTYGLRFVAFCATGRHNIIRITHWGLFHVERIQFSRYFDYRWPSCILSLLVHVFHQLTWFTSFPWWFLSNAIRIYIYISYFYVYIYICPCWTQAHGRFWYQKPPLFFRLQHPPSPSSEPRSGACVLNLTTGGWTCFFRVTRWEENYVIET